jgi:Predicted dehydrogenase
MVEHVEAVVIGAGVIGLAVARRLALAGREVIVLEATNGIGNGTSSRNSEVIHAGLYYPTGSLKARLCVAGKHALYRYCAEQGIPHKCIGKLIVATDEAQVDTLKQLWDKGRANGVNDLELIHGKTVHRMEPHLRSVAALLSPSTGIIDSLSLMLAYQGDAERSGAMIAFLSRVVGGHVTDKGIELKVASSDGSETLLVAKLLVNAAGLKAQAVARRIEGLRHDSIPPLYLAKGNYFALVASSPSSRLIYPIPEPGGLGVHLTLDLGGQARFGPDVEWVNTINYDVDPARAERFYPAIRTYYPHLPDNALHPAYAGIRPKLVPASSPFADFAILGPETHGVSGLINLYGIESPGLTASLALAEEVVARLGLA